MNVRALFFTFVLSFPLVTISLSLSQEKPSLSQIDRMRIAEAFLISDELGNKIWDDWDKAPFALLLVTQESEFLVRHPQPSDDFISLGHDELLKSDVFYRKRVYQPNLLATFPAVNGLSTIVIGQAENTTAKTSTAWVTTVLHEHFHQLQYSQPDYYEKVNALNLARGDQSGMWMLNYPFPYDSADVNRHFTYLCNLLYDALVTRESGGLPLKTFKYLRAKEEFQSVLSEDDYKYFSFQLWQEGVAQYTQYRVARLAAEQYTPSEAFRELPDYTPFSAEADTLYKKIIEQLPSLSLAKKRRTVVYPFGAAEAMLLDAVNPMWQRAYFKEKFYLERQFQKE